MPEQNEVTGRIIHVNPDKGYGFIISHEVKFTRIYFHWSSLVQDTLNFKDVQKGMFCKFTPKEVEGKGTRAIRIRICETPSPVEVEKLDEAEKDVVEN